MKRFRDRLIPLVLTLLVCGAAMSVCAKAATIAGQTEETKQTKEAGETGEAKGLAGSIWKLAEMEAGGTKVTKEEVKKYEDLGMVMYLELSENGNAVLYGFGDELKGSWDENAITLNGSAFSYTAEGDVLKIRNDDGEEIRFDKTTREEINRIMGYEEGILDEKISYSKEKEKILDTEDACVTITGYRADRTGFRVSFLCENKRDSKILVGAEKSVLNKCAIDPSWAVSLEAGDKKDVDMVFKPADLKKTGISAVDEMILEFKVVDNEKWAILQDGIFATVYPTGKKAADIKAADRVPAEKEQTVLDNEDFTYVLQESVPEGTVGYTINYYFENKTDDVLKYMWKETSVNDKDVNIICAGEVLPGTRGYSRAYIMEATLQKAEIAPADVKKVEGSLEVYKETEKALERLYRQEFTYVP